MAKKMWAGRFEKATDEAVNDFNSSLPFDCRMYKQDIEGSVAHSQMLAKQGIISHEDADKIREGQCSGSFERQDKRFERRRRYHALVRSFVCQDA